jgi:hypothetical protein
MLATKKIEYGYERDYWGLSYRKGVEFINKRDRRDTVVLPVDNIISVQNNISLLPVPEQSRFYFAIVVGNYRPSGPNAPVYLTRKPDYYITEYRFTRGSRPETIMFNNHKYTVGKKRYSVEVDGFPILGVYSIST